MGEMDIIREFVRYTREKERIMPTEGYKFEMSCFAHGEGQNLLYRQLIPTTDGCGGWEELEDPEIRDLVLDVIKKTGYGRNLHNLEEAVHGLELKDRVFAFDFDELLVEDHLAKRVTERIGQVDQEKLQELGPNSYDGIAYLNSLFFGLSEMDYHHILTSEITPLRAGFKDTLKELDKDNSVLMISSGLADICRRTAPGYQVIGGEFDKNGHIRGSRLILSDILKGYVTRWLSRDRDVIAIGHSSGDIPMLKNADLGIAFGYDIDAEYHIEDPEELLLIR